MKEVLPDQSSPQVLPSTVMKKIKDLLPRISRFITERFSREKSIYYFKMLMVSFFSGILFMSIIFQGISFLHNLEAIQKMKEERGKVAEEIHYWKQTAEKYQGYRDVYFRIAALEYKAGDLTESKKYMEKVLELDPNFEGVEVLGEKKEK